jgi:hypothetical protein
MMNIECKWNDDGKELLIYSVNRLIGYVSMSEYDTEPVLKLKSDNSNLVFPSSLTFSELYVIMDCWYNLPYENK